MNAPHWLDETIDRAMHSALIAEHGGADGVRDDGLHASALARPMNLRAYGTPTLFDLAASYAFGLAKNHAFVDGNKRIALMAAYTFLRLNGYRLVADEAETVVTFRDLAAGALDEPALARWLEANCRALEG